MKLLLIAVLALSGCGHVVTLYPRGKGETATGSLNDGTRSMTINLKGTTYSGKFIRGQTFGFGVNQSVGTTPRLGTTMMVGNSNQASALLVSSDGKSVLRCELTVAAASGGNGVCVDKDDIVYDANIQLK